MLEDPLVSRLIKYLTKTGRCAHYPVRNGRELRLAHVIHQRKGRGVYAQLVRSALGLRILRGDRLNIELTEDSFRDVCKSLSERRDKVSYLAERYLS